MFYIKENWMHSILTHANVFINSRFMLVNEPHDLAHFSVKLGDFLLTPIRYLMKGDEIFISYPQGEAKDAVPIFHISKREFPDNGYPHLQTAAAVIAWAGAFFLLGGVFKGILLSGIVLKSLGYLSASIRQEHNLAVDHLVPFIPGRKQEIGDMTTPFDRDMLNAALESVQTLLWTKGPIDTLVIYPHEGLNMHDFPLIANLKPKKILWVQNKAAQYLQKPEESKLFQALLQCDHYWNAYVSSCKKYGLVAHACNVEQALAEEITYVKRVIYIIDAKKPDAWV